MFISFEEATIPSIISLQVELFLMQILDLLLVLTVHLFRNSSFISLTIFLECHLTFQMFCNPEVIDSSWGCIHGCPIMFVLPSRCTQFLTIGYFHKPPPWCEKMMEKEVRNGHLFYSSSFALNLSLPKKVVSWVINDTGCHYTTIWLFLIFIYRESYQRAKRKL